MFVVVAMINELICLGKRIKKLRKKNGYTLEKFAEIVDISPNHISKLEAAKTNPSFQLLSRIAGAFNISLMDLFDFSEYISDDVTREDFMQMVKYSDVKYLKLLYRIHKDIIYN